MLSAQSNYHLNNKDSAAAEFVNMIQNEANNYLSNMSTLSHVSKMCSSLSAHWPPALGAVNHQSPLAQSQLPMAPTSAAAAAAAAALAAGHNIDAILGGSYSIKIENDNKNGHVVQGQSGAATGQQVQQHQMKGMVSHEHHRSLPPQGSGHYSSAVGPVKDKNSKSHSDFNNSYDAGKLLDTAIFFYQASE